jgi:hypothetical protein
MLFNFRSVSDYVFLTTLFIHQSVKTLLSRRSDSPAGLLCNPWAFMSSCRNCAEGLSKVNCGPFYSCVLMTLFKVIYPGIPTLSTSLKFSWCEPHLWWLFMILWRLFCQKVEICQMCMLSNILEIRGEHFFALEWIILFLLYMCTLYNGWFQSWC